MTANSPDAPRSPTPDAYRLGVVSFLNARPLWRTLARREGLTILPAVPSRLAGMLAEAACDVALLPVVDYWQARRRLVRVSDACIASDGETMTVRVFSRVPPKDIRRLHADTDSHTSVVLAKALWRQLYGCRLEVVPRPAATRSVGPLRPTWKARGPLQEAVEPIVHPAKPPKESVEPPRDVEALLLIGDKVITAAPSDFAFQVDLGAAWKELTGLPFVFAAWYGRRDRHHEVVARLLQAARDVGLEMIEQIAAEEAPWHGWPPETALRYLRDCMRYTLTPAMRAGMDRFFTLVHEHDLLE